MTPTPREKQRHADAGTPVDELRELMGYDSMTVTQTYYRVTAKRTRAAVDRLAALQFDGRGNRIWRQARALLEHEHQRLAVGQVPSRSGSAPSPPTCKPAGMPARSGSAAWAVVTFAPTRPTCRSCAATSTCCCATVNGSALRSSWTIGLAPRDRKSTRLNSSHVRIS